RSKVERLMTLSTSAVAACCSRASFSSRISAATCSGGSGHICEIGTLRALGLVVRCPFAGCPLPPRRCMSPPAAGSRRCSILGKSQRSRHGRMSAKANMAPPPKATFSNFVCHADRTFENPELTKLGCGLVARGERGMGRGVGNSRARGEQAIDDRRNCPIYLSFDSAARDRPVHAVVAYTKNPTAYA